MLDRLSSFRSHSIGQIINSANSQIFQLMSQTYYTKISIVVMILRMQVIDIIVKIICLIKLQIQRQFLAPIIIDTIINVFYKATRNARLTFNLVIVECLTFFFTRILILLFTIIYCSIIEYQNEKMIIKSLDKKIVQSLYCYIQSQLH